MGISVRWIFKDAATLVGGLCTGLVMAAAPTLPDTGQTTCDNGSNVMVACSSANTGDTATYPRQDGRFGSDPKAAAGTLVKTGGGVAGFDYTKVAYAGNDLPSGAVQGSLVTDWSCTRDNITGLTWEVKTPPAGYGALQMHASDNLYFWYNGNSTTNGGNWGCPGLTCEVPPVALSCHTTSGCNTGSFAVDVNATTLPLCGYRDWRVATRRELLTLINAGAVGPSIDANYFPNVNGEYWTDTSATVNTGNAWTVSLTNGGTAFRAKNSAFPVILVRGAQF